MLEKIERTKSKNKVLHLDNPAGVTSCFRVPSTGCSNWKCTILAKPSALFVCPCRKQQRVQRINAEMGSERLAPQALFGNDALTRLQHDNQVNTHGYKEAEGIKGALKDGGSHYTSNEGLVRSSGTVFVRTER